MDSIEKKMAEMMGEGGVTPPPPEEKKKKIHWQLEVAKTAGPPKTKEEVQAADILKSDKAQKELYGFDESDIAAASNRYSHLY